MESEQEAALGELYDVIGHKPGQGATKAGGKAGGKGGGLRIMKGAVAMTVKLELGRIAVHFVPSTEEANVLAELGLAGVRMGMARSQNGASEFSVECDAIIAEDKSKHTHWPQMARRVHPSPEQGPPMAPPTPNGSPEQGPPLVRLKASKAGTSAAVIKAKLELAPLCLTLAHGDFTCHTQLLEFFRAPPSLHRPHIPLPPPGHVKNVSPNQLQPSGNPKLRHGVCEVTVGFEPNNTVSTCYCIRST